ncbi:MAG TPA: formimidoylglutamate deiminase [Nocardioidaceae bacterium]|nr:formimidoylglutamate deiminase [Nocardioidaceae bacterium]
MSVSAYWCERAWLGPGDVADDVLVEVEEQRIRSVRRDRSPGAAHRLAGLTIPGLANCHSHAFHRALRGRTQRGLGTFWTWREQMYAVARRLDPDSYYRLAFATYAEMALAGITCVGEFHYLHHQPDGTPYDDPNAMGEAVIAAATDAGLRIALLDTCYLSAGFGAPPEGVQIRYHDGSADAWGVRVADLAARHPAAADAAAEVGAAIHSVRAVPADQMPVVAALLPAAPLHAHVSEQVAENDACGQRYGRTPTAVLADAGAVSARFTAVHATHLSAADVGILGDAAAYACFCPTTERDLADGIGPARALADAGARLTLGSDSQAVIDPFEEMRAMELDERLSTRRRGHWPAGELLRAATSEGHAALGFPDAGRIAPGGWADLVTVDTGSVRTAGAGAGEEAAVYAASAVDVTHVLAGGRVVEHDPAEVARLLADAVEEVLAS